MTLKSRKPSAVAPNQLANNSVLSDDELNAVSGGVRKSAGGQASGVMFLAFTFKLVAV
ncbi:MAG TPA: bacteriocin [Acetobacteraceae bacterium]|nr:bacteriocin [Acetobacteraceae bacterium]